MYKIPKKAYLPIGVEIKCKSKGNKHMNTAPKTEALRRKQKGREKSVIKETRLQRIVDKIG
jgi:hypothetical protein